jgi:hypothetical protein
MAAKKYLHRKSKSKKVLIVIVIFDASLSLHRWLIWLLLCFSTGIMKQIALCNCDGFERADQGKL